MPDNLMPGETGGIPNGLLDKFKKQDNSSPVTVDDVNSYNFGLSPEQEQMYNASQEKYTPAREPMSVHDYYPNQGDPIGVGTSSGRIIGTQTQYVPNGALVPIGKWDARDAAVQKAALMKARDVEDWKKRNETAPTSKLTNINDNIRQEFFKHQNQSWQQAVKASGGDAQKAKYMLENNPDFQAKNKSFYDQAKMGDAIVAQDAQLEDDVRTGKKVLTPAMVDARRKLHSATNPDSDEFKDFSSAYTSYNAVNEFNNAYNDVVDHMTRQKLAEAGIDESNPEYFREYKSTKENFTPEQLQAQEDALNQMYSGGRGGELYTPDFIKKQVWGKGSNVREEKSVDAKLKPRDPGEGDTYDDATSVVAESEENYGTGDAVRSTVSEHYVPAGAKDQKKTVKVALSDHDYSATGDKHVGRSGNVEGSVQGWAVKLYDNKKKVYLQPEEAKAIEKMMAEGNTRQEHDYTWKPVAIYNVVPKKGKTANETTPQETIIMDADKFAGVFKGKNKKENGKDFDEMREKTIEYAKERNKAIKQPKAKETMHKIKGKEFSASAIEKAAKASGMSVEEYLSEVNK
jgi:hypothetical protein